MHTVISSKSFHKSLARDVLGTDPSEIAVMCFMMIVHGCNILLRETVKSSENCTGFAPITTRHAAEVVAKRFQESPKNNGYYWYERWNGDWNAYAILESIPPTLIEPLRIMLQRLEEHPWIAQITDEDWEIAGLLDSEN